MNTRWGYYAFVDSVLAGVNVGLYAWTGNPICLGVGVFIGLLAVFFSIAAHTD